MSTHSLSMACWDYDRTRPLIDGRVKPSGIDLRVQVMRPREAFERMLATGEFDVCEMSFSNYVTLRAEANCPLLALPVMLSKMFRHDCIYVRKDSGITHPRDLMGRRVGTMRYTSTALVFARGLLQHEYGLHARDFHWFVGGINHGISASRPEHTPDDLKITLLKKEMTLDQMLVDGEVDALITQDIPSSFLKRHPNIVRLFPDFKTVESDYYQRTGIFPVMHTVVIKSQAYRETPEIAQSIYTAFCKAKDIATEGLYDTDALHLTLPFLIDHVEEAWKIFGKDYFSYGLEPNRATISALCQYVHEQRLSSRLVSPDELFAPVTGH